MDANRGFDAPRSGAEPALGGGSDAPTNGMEPGLGGKNRPFVPPRNVHASSSLRTIATKQRLHLLANLPEAKYFQRNVKHFTGEALANITVAQQDWVFSKRDIIAHPEEHRQFVMGYLRDTNEGQAFEAVSTVRIADEARVEVSLVSRVEQEPLPEQEVVGQIFWAKVLAAHLGMGVRFTFSQGAEGQQFRHVLSELVERDIDESRGSYFMSNTEIAAYEARGL